MLNQVQYIVNIFDYDIIFGVGLVGMGKIYLVVVVVVDVLECQEICCILLICLVVEVGEKLGFLFGDLSQKVDLYLCLLYDVLFEMLGFEKVEKLIECNVIEVVLLVYMCGCMLNDVFIIFDESQNIIIEQMKMFLICIGFNLKVVIIGDVMQIDLLCNIKLGLCYVIEVLVDVEEISFNFFYSEDVVCYLVVVCIVNVYEVWEEVE